MFRIFGEELIANLQRCGKVPVLQLPPCLGIGMVQQVVFGANLLIELLVYGSPIRRECIRCAAVHFQNALEFC
jgi:hypothetical protein